MRRASIPCCLLLSLGVVLAASPAAAWYVIAGAGESDVGLDGTGTGYNLGFGGSWPIAEGPFDVSAELAYVQRAGSQPMYFTSTESGLFLDDAKVRLHMIRPAFFGGVNLLQGTVVPRAYAGFSAGVKVSESWDKPEGETNQVYGYEDIDAEFHAGLSVGVGRFLLDFRYNHGLLEQLVVRDADNAGPWEKADDDLDGVETPEDGATVTSWQLGLAVGF